MYKLREELAASRGGGEDGALNSTLKKGGVKITRTKSSTLEEIEEIVRRKTFVILQKNIKNCLSGGRFDKYTILLLRKVIIIIICL